MEKIKFRAKSLFSGNFIKGNYLKTVFKDGEDNHKIYPFLYNVPPEDIDVKTLGQFTGLKDKNGTDIYEGDIVRKVIELDGGVINNWIVFYGEGGFDIKRVKENGETTTMYLKNYWKHTYEVIGNIHENLNLWK